MRIMGLLTVAICGSLLIFFTAEFPGFGDPASPASSHLSPYFIENSLKDTHVPNIVTSILADYRGYDTMFETTVIFAAGLSCFFLLRKPEKKHPKARFYRHIPTGVTLRIQEGGKLPQNNSKVFQPIDSLWTPHSPIIKTTCRLVIPFIQLFGLYVIGHGHYSPGGGFQGGVILGASIILMAISHDLRESIRRVSEKMTAWLGAMGVIIYAGTGALCLISGANFLDYSALAPLLGSDPVTARSHGILIVEIGVAFAVMAVMTWIYYNLSSAGKQDEGL